MSERSFCIFRRIHVRLTWASQVAYDCFFFPPLVTKTDTWIRTLGADDLRVQWRRRLAASKRMDGFCPRTQRICLIRRSDCLLLFPGYRPMNSAVRTSTRPRRCRQYLTRAGKEEEAPISLIYCTDRQYLCRP